MSKEFDAYYKWLSIAPEEQPPNHYRLLGTNLYESDPDVIEAAADQRMAHLRKYQSGKHSKLSQKLLNEVSAARITLLNPEKKAAYDEQLKQQLAPKPDEPLDLSGNETGGTTLPAPAALATTSTSSVAGPTTNSKPARARPAWLVPVTVSVAAVLLLGAVGAIIVTNAKDDDAAQPVAEQEPNEQPSREASPSKNPLPSEPLPDAGPESKRSPTGSPNDVALQQQPKGRVVTIPADSKKGYSLGSMKQGSTITLQYIDGKWKGWGRKPDISPDKTDGRGEGTCLLAIVAFTDQPGDGDVLQLVPEGTREDPFVYRVDRDYDELVLRINDHGTWESNPGKVQYKMSVQPPAEQVAKMQQPDGPRDDQPQQRDSKKSPFEPIGKLEAKTESTPPDTAEQTPASTDQTEPTGTTDAEKVEKHPVPTNDRQKPTLATLEETFELSKERTPEEQLELAHEFLRLARDSKDPVGKFVLLRGAINYAGQGGDARLVLEAVDEIDRNFEIDRFDIGQKALACYGSRAASEEAMASLADAASKFIEEAMAARRLDVAKNLAESVYNQMLSRPVDAEHRKQVFDQRKRVNELYSEWKPVRDALERLKTKPEDPTANATVGKWYAFEEGDWESAFRYLAKSNDKPLSTLAQREMNAKSLPVEQQVALGDDWWNAAANADGEMKEALLHRAGYWYRKSADELEGLTKARAEKRIEEIAQILPHGSGRPQPAVAPFAAAEAKQHQQTWAQYLGEPLEKEISLPGELKLTLVLIPPGEFLMGSTEEERNHFLEGSAAGKKWAVKRFPHEAPRHLVRITKPFYIGKYEVTRGQFAEFVKGTKYEFKLQDGDPTLPQTNVTWNEALAFCQWLTKSHSDGLKFLLPSEAQWEYACRAGTTTFWYSGNQEADLLEYGWHEKNSNDNPHPVGQLRPNAFGLYDMHGNRYEFCADWMGAQYYSQSITDDPTGPFLGEDRVKRGGWSGSPAWELRSAYRGEMGPDSRSDLVGFRVAAVLTENPAAQIEPKRTSQPRFMPGILVRVYPKHPAQEKGHVWLMPNDMGKPIGHKVINSLESWSCPKEHNAVALGYIKIDKPGEYGFNCTSFYGRKLLAVNGRLLFLKGDNKKEIKRIVLPKGMIPIVSAVYVHGKSFAKILWQPPGQENLSPIPPSLLFYDANDVIQP